MVGGIVIAGIIISCLFAAAVLVHIFIVPIGSLEEELKAFTVLVYRQDDELFEAKLRRMLSQLRWIEPCFYSEIYIVHMNVPDVQSESVREMCNAKKNLVYISMDEFINIIHN